ncbi:MAG: glycosyltransferase [Methylobacterium sp.]|nr:glycosyltransferase [Methylobacterium sp.]
MRFALLPDPSAWTRRLVALRSLLRHPRLALSLASVRLSGKRVRARQGFAALLGLDHHALWRSDGDTSSFGGGSASGNAETVFLIHTAPGHTLAAGAGSRIAAAFASDPDLQALYGDALASFPDGSILPLLRPAFDPDYLLAVDYIGPVIALRRTGLVPIELPDDASPTFAAECLLRTADRFGSGAIRHLPQFLSQWSVGAGGEGSSSHRSARLALVEKRGLTARIDEHGVITVLRPLPEQRPLVSLIVPTRDRLDLLRPCLDSLRRATDWPACEILICDNDSAEVETLAYLRDLTEQGIARIVACPGPFNFAAMNNAAAAAARGRLLAFVNNDVEAFAPDWLELMCREAMRPDVGAVGARLLDGEGRIQHGGVVLGPGGLVTHGHRFFPGDALGYLSALRATREVSAVTAACLVVEAEKFRAVGGFDAETFPVDFNDVDLCLRLRQAGFRTLYVGGAVLHHREAASRRRSAETQSRHRREVEAFRRRWGPLLAQDPHYHPGFDPDLGTYARLR